MHVTNDAVAVALDAAAAILFTDTFNSKAAHVNGGIPIFIAGL